MNSYWIEHQARQRVSQMAADARGDMLGAEAARQATDGPDRPAERARLWRVRTRIQRFAIRQLGLAGRSR